MKKTLILAALGAAATVGAIVGFPEAEAAQGATIELTPAECARILKAWPTGSCAVHAQARIDVLLEDADRRVLANRARDVVLLDKADITDLDAKIKVKRDALKAAEAEKDPR